MRPSSAESRGSDARWRSMPAHVRKPPERTDAPDPKNTARPALMRWEIYEAGNEFGDLHNAMPVPDAGRRKIVWDVQKTPAVPTPENTEGARSPAPGGR